MSQTQITAHLKGLSERVEGKSFALEGNEALIGRGTKCQVQLQDPKISRQHARIRFEEGIPIIEDLKSSHGTLVNGQRVLSAELKAGDEITLGDTTLGFEPAPDAVATMLVDDPEAVVMTACRQCGEQIEVDKPFCPHCGKPLREPVEPKAVAESSPQPPQAAQTPAPPAEIPPIPHPVMPADRSKQRRWPLFIVGLSIPLILGFLVVFALVMLGVFEEEEYQGSIGELPVDPPSAGEQDRTDGGETLEDSSDVVDAPSYTFRAYNPATDASLPAQLDLALYPDEGGEAGFLYEIVLAPTEEMILDYFYCGKSEQLLTDIEGAIGVEYQIGDENFPQESLHKELLVTDTRACYVFRGVISAVSADALVLLQTMSVTESIYDGWETWGPEDLVSQILFRITDGADMNFETSDSGTEVLPPDIPTVVLHYGDARMFSQPPEVIAYANTQARSAPPEIAISEGCAEDCLRYYEWLGIPEANQWIEASTTISATAMGVQLWSDTTGGLARIYLDGEEVWSGDTRGEDNLWPGGAFVRYLEISGLADTTHSLKVEALGEGGPVTTYFFGVGAVIP